MDFLYDESGSPYSFIYNGYQYYYVKNLQGDVMRIVDTSGTVVANYFYDAWGKVTSSGNVVGQYNPIRYRGYYYDTDTGFYYLQSRYYDPTIKRFISADKEISGVGGELLGYNQYAYSFNNPVNLSDESGEWPSWVTKSLAVGLVAGAILGATILTVVTYGPGSTVGTAMITGSITIAAKAWEVGHLQKSKSESEGKSDFDVNVDIVEAWCDNGKFIIGITPLTKTGSLAKDYYMCSGGIKTIKNAGFKALFSKATLKTTLEKKVVDKRLSYLLAFLSVAHLIDTMRSENPIERAEDRGIILN